MFIRFQDLENHILEFSSNKGNFLMLNKADLLKKKIKLNQINKRKSGAISEK